MQRCSATTIVCLVEDHELAERWPEYVDWLNERLGDSAVWFPIHDLHAPPLDGVRPLLDDLVSRLDRGEHLLIHCAAGIGRAGTIGTCLLIRRGMAPDAALAHIAACRPMAGPEVGTQLDLVNALAAEHGHRA